MADAARADASHEEHDGKFQLPFAPTPPRRSLAPARSGWRPSRRNSAHSSRAHTQGPDAWRQGLGTEHDMGAQTAVAREVPAY